MTAGGVAPKARPAGLSEGEGGADGSAPEINEDESFRRYSAPSTASHRVTVPAGHVARPTPTSSDREPFRASRPRQDLRSIPTETPGSDRMVNAVVRRITQRPGPDWQTNVRDNATTFGAGERAVLAALETKATAEQRSFLIRNGFPLKGEVDEDYQNGSSGGYQSQATSAAPQAPTGPKPAAKPGQTATPKLPRKPITKPDLDKAAKLADKIADTPNLALDQHGVIDTQIKQKIGSIGGRPDQAGVMGNLVRAELANRGFEIEEGINDFLGEKGFMDTVRSITGRKAPAAAPVLTATRPAPAQAQPSAAPAPVLTRTTVVPYATTLARRDVQDAFVRMIDTLGLPSSTGNAIDRSMVKKGSWTGFVDGRYARFPETTWARIRQRLQPFFSVTVSGEGDHCKLTITLNH